MNQCFGRLKSFSESFQTSFLFFKFLELFFIFLFLIISQNSFQAKMKTRKMKIGSKKVKTTSKTIQKNFLVVQNTDSFTVLMFSSNFVRYPSIWSDPVLYVLQQVCVSWQQFSFFQVSSLTNVQNKIKTFPVCVKI